MIKLVKGNEYFMYAVIFLVMVNNVEHLAWVHYDIARHVFSNTWMNMAHSVAVVLIIELAIIVLVRKGMDVFAGVYTFMLLCLNLLYYPLPDYLENGEYGRFVAAIIYSLMFTLSIFYFARMAAMKKRDQDLSEDYKKKWWAANKELEQAGSKLQQVAAELQQEKKGHEKLTAELQQFRASGSKPAAELQQLESELQQLREFRQQVVAARTCEHCGQEFESEASKRSHTGRCAVKKNNYEAIKTV